MKLSAVVALAKYSQGIWKKAQRQGWEVDRQEKVKPEEWEEVPKRRMWMLGHGFYKPTSV